ncbi:hypothetical protein OUZ56_017558 [Daphnia magna]|uniref:Uncharacterized protein n=1 Tax=Daphnia magna TaxID=35525 RepID=A0ABR0AT29_9CRUS|nr:hypothetical protein OUZ56_017558 [Daphnia magna]
MINDGYIDPYDSLEAIFELELASDNLQMVRQRPSPYNHHLSYTLVSHSNGASEPTPCWKTATVRFGICWTFMLDLPNELVPHSKSEVILVKNINKAEAKI